MFTPTPKQEEFFKLCKTDAKYILAFGGRRASKSFGCNFYIANRALLVGGSRHYIFRLRRNKVLECTWEQSWYEMMKVCFPNILSQPKKKWWWDRQKSMLTFYNNSKVWFLGLEEVCGSESSLGTDASTMLFEECSEILYSQFDVVKGSLAQNCGLSRKFLFNMNPPKRSHWTYKLFMEKKDPKTGEELTDPENYQWLRMNPVDNPHLSQDYIQELKKMTGDSLKRFYYGDFTDAVENGVYSTEVLNAHKEGRIYKDRLEPAPKVPINIVAAFDGNNGVSLWMCQYFSVHDSFGLDNNRIYLLDYEEFDNTTFLEALPRMVSDSLPGNHKVSKIFLPEEVFKRAQGRYNIPEIVCRYVDLFNLGLGFYDKQDEYKAIDSVKTAFSRMHFDGKKCDRGIQMIEEYSYGYDEEKQMRTKPIVDYTNKAVKGIAGVVQCFYMPLTKKRMKLYESENRMIWGTDEDENLRIPKHRRQYYKFY
jgi:hypothetical protein